MMTLLTVMVQILGVPLLTLLFIEAVWEKWRSPSS